MEVSVEALAADRWGSGFRRLSGLFEGQFHPPGVACRSVAELASGGIYLVREEMEIDKR